MKLKLLAGLYLVPLLGLAQQFTISGFIEDAQSRERLIGVNVYLAGTTYGTSTNTFGYYSLKVPAGTYELRVSFIGYQGGTDSIVLDRNRQLDFLLTETTQDLPEVEVTAEEPIVEQARMSTINLKSSDIKKIPAFLGEVDIIRAIQLLPGVQSGSEGTTGFYVRGGSPDQNLILLDGVPVYNASHLFGFFSVFNADAIKNVQLTKGGFPARYGGRLSSVLEIDMKEGNMQEFHGEGSIGLVASKLTLEGPIVKDKTSFMVSGRRTYIDVLAAPFINTDDSRAGYYFGDINAKVNHVFSRKDRLYLSYYGGTDHFYFSETEQSFSGGETEFTGRLKWGNHTGALRWNHLFNDRLFSNLTATFTQYEFETGFEEESRNGSGTPAVQGFGYISKIRDFGARYDLEYTLDAKHSLRAGASYTYHIFQPGAVQFLQTDARIDLDSTLNLSRPLFANDIFLYAEDDYHISDRWRANYGLHYSLYFLRETSYQALQPRVSLRYLARDNWSLKASYALMNQYIHLLSNTGIGLPTDLWVSSTDRIQPQISQQVALGTSHNLVGQRYEISVEGYYKWMDNLIEYKEGAGFTQTANWENQVETDGQGRAYGVELLLRKNEGKTTGWIGYTLAWTNRQFSNLNNGEWFPYRYDRRHDISVVVNHEFSDRFDMGLTWVYGTGNTFTAPVANYLAGSPFGLARGFHNVERFSSRNGQRLPAYHRLDLGLNFHKKTKWGQRTWNISAYNAYNRQNPFFLYLADNQDGSREVRQVSLFPIIPAIAYIFKF